jgi:copper chaperone CopZ
MKFRRILLGACLLFLLKTQAASIQFISIGVNGLTCSMCTRSVEMSIRKLDFVDSVVMDLENTEGKVFIKSNATPDFRLIAKAVSNAGFSVRFMRISVDLTDLSTWKDCFTINGNAFQQIDDAQSPSTTVIQLTLVGNEYMPKKAALAFRKKPEPCLSDKPVYYVSLR